MAKHFLLYLTLIPFIIFMFSGCFKQQLDFTEILQTELDKYKENGALYINDDDNLLSHYGQLEIEDELESKIIDLTAKQLRYKVLSVKNISDNTVTVKCEMSTIDLKVLLTDAENKWQKKIVSIVINNNTVGQEEFDHTGDILSYLEDSINGDSPRLNRIVDIYFVKQDKEWVGDQRKNALCYETMTGDSTDAIAMASVILDKTVNLVERAR